RHGGQVRSHQVVKALERAGLSVTSISVVDQCAYPKAISLGPNDLYFPLGSPHRFFNGKEAPGYVSDYLSGLYAAEDEPAYQAILRAVPQKLDVIFLEQPWMLPVALKLRKDRDARLLIYDAQNNETALKRGILATVGNGESERLLEAMNATEKAACA